MTQHHTAQVNAEALENFQLLHAARSQRGMGADRRTRFCMSAGCRTEDLCFRLGDFLGCSDLTDQFCTDARILDTDGQFPDHDIAQLLLRQGVAFRREKRFFVVACSMGDLHACRRRDLLGIRHIAPHAAVGLVNDADHTTLHKMTVFRHRCVKIIQAAVDIVLRAGKVDGGMFMCV